MFGEEQDSDESDRVELELALNDGLGSMPSPELIELVGEERAWALHNQKQTDLLRVTRTFR